MGALLEMSRLGRVRCWGLRARRHRQIEAELLLRGSWCEARPPGLPSLALRGHKPDNLEPRPDLANVSLAVRRILSAARQKEGRDALALYWMQDAPDARDWRLRNMSAGELDDLDRARERNMQIEKDRLAAAAFAAGQRSGPPETKRENPEPKANSERVVAVLAAALE